MGKDIGRPLLWQIRNAMIRAKLQEKLHSVRGQITEIARRDAISMDFKHDAEDIDKMLCREIAKLDLS